MIRKIKTHIAKIIIFFILIVMIIWSCSITYIGVRHSNNVNVDADQDREFDSVTLFGGETLDLGLEVNRRRRKTDTIIQTDTIHATK